MFETSTEQKEMTLPRPRNRRRRILSRPADQFRTSLVPTIGAALLLFLLVTAVHYLTAARTRDLTQYNPAFRELLEDQALFMEATLATGAIAYLACLLIVGLFHSRRLMGALFAMDRRIRHLADGDLTTPLRLRRGDYFHDVAEGLNAAAASLRRQAEQDLADVDDLISILDRSPHAGPLRDGLRETLIEVRDRKRRLLGLPEPEPAACEADLAEAFRR